jgi:hypothetical protein
MLPLIKIRFLFIFILLFSIPLLAFLVYDQLTESLNPYHPSTLHSLKIAQKIFLGIHLLFAFALWAFFLKPLQQQISSLSASFTKNLLELHKEFNFLGKNLNPLIQEFSPQEKNLKETNVLVEELFRLIHQGKLHSLHAHEVAQETRKNGESVSKALNHLEKTVDEIQNTSVETVKIIRILEEITSQTHLLSVNASVEASRSGEAGKGFAVIAESVRKLALRGSDNVKNTSALLQRSQKNIQKLLKESKEVTHYFGKTLSDSNKLNFLIEKILSNFQDQERQSPGLSQGIQHIHHFLEHTSSHSFSCKNSSKKLEALFSRIKETPSVAPLTPSPSEALLPPFSLKKHSASVASSEKRKIPLVSPPNPEEFKDF